MTGKLSKNFHGVGIGPLSKILAVKVEHDSGNERTRYYNENEIEQAERLRSLAVSDTFTVVLP